MSSPPPPPRTSQRSQATGMTFEETVQAIIEFIEVAIQCILKARQIYPPESFAPRRKYGLMVWQTRHPGVSQYFAEALNAIRSQLLLRDTMEGEVGVRLHHRTTDQEFERYTFHTLPFLSKDSVTLTRSTLHLYFRSILARLLELEQLPPSGEAEDRTVSLTWTAFEAHFDTEDWSRTTIPPGPRLGLGPMTIDTGVLEVKVTGAGMPWSASSQQQLREDHDPSAASFTHIPLTTAGVRSAADFGDDPVEIED